MNEKELLWRIGQRVKEIREEKGITQQSIANNIDTDRANISRLESGRVDSRISTLFRIATDLGVPLPTLLEIDYTEAKQKK
jgi:transcriptional regulator with XRE-family HTH domain